MHNQVEDDKIEDVKARTLLKERIVEEEGI
jgi:hypothetical protein